MRKNPYVGPRAFRAGEKLPAREVETSCLADLLIAERIVLLHSPSGAGKSSLIHAGVVPLLEGTHEGRRRTATSFRAVPLRVNTPVPLERRVHNRYVYSTALDLLPDHGPQEIEPLTFQEVLERAKQRVPSATPVLIFDQFEEILTLNPADRDSQEVFFQELGSALDRGDIWVLFSMREDYIGGLAPFRPYLPGYLHATYRLDFLDSEAAKIAVRQPALDQGVSFSSAAADELLRRLSTVKVQRPGTGVVDEIQAPYVLPFQLQVMCRRLWRSLAKEKGDAFNLVELRDIEAYGDVDGALRDYYADTVRDIASQAEDPLIREWEIRDWVAKQLITEQHFRSQTHTSPVPVSHEAYPGQVREALESAYIIRSDTRAGTTWYELSHDNLIEPILESNTRAREARETGPRQRPAATPTAYGGMLLVLTGHASAAHGVAFAPDGHQLASASDDGTVRLWNSARGDLTALLREHQDRVRGVAFAPDGHQLASASDDGTVRLWDRATQQLIKTLGGHAGEVNGVVFSPYGLLASGGNDGTVRLWETASGQMATLTGHKDRVQAVAFSPDGRLLASGSSDHTLRLWDPVTREVIAILTDHSRVYGVAFSPDGRLLASGGRARTVRLWDLVTRQLIGTLEGHTGFVNAVAFSPDGRQLASAGDDGVRLWDPATRQPITSLEGHIGPVLGAAFSPDARRLATAGNDRTVRLWNVASIPDVPM